MRNVPHAHTDTHSLNRITTPTRTPRSYVSRRYPGPMYVITTPFTTQHRYHAHVSFVFLSFALRDRNSGYTPRARPRARTASGFRPSGLPTPDSLGVPTGARNLCVCVILFRVSFRNHPLFLSFLNPPHPELNPPTFLHSISSCTLVFLSRTSYRFPRIPRFTRLREEGG